MKNKVKILLAAFAFICASLSLAIAQEDPQRIICHCTVLANCKASGSSGVCAQSEPGGNIQCSQYNSNCGY